MMLKFYMGFYGNFYFNIYFYGWEINIVVENVRVYVVKMINVDFKEIIFILGVIEFNNMVFKGVLRFYKKIKKYIIIIRMEYKCVLEVVWVMMKEGFEVIFLNVDD